MGDFESVVKFSPVGVAKVLRRLSDLRGADASVAPALTLFLRGGGVLAGVLLQFGKESTPPFIVTLGAFGEDGAVENVSYIPLTEISAVTVHRPLSVASVLAAAPAPEEGA